MEFLQAFPIAIIDEDYEGKRAAGRGMGGSILVNKLLPQFSYQLRGASDSD